MVAHLNDEYVDCVVNGPFAKGGEGVSCRDPEHPDISKCTDLAPYRPRPRKLVGCEFVSRQSIDHKRHHVANK